MLCYETFNDTAFIFQTDKGIWQPSEGTPDGLGSGAETAAGDLFIVLLILILVVETESEENEILKRQTSKWASMMSVLRTLLLLLMICLAVVTSSVAGERLQLLVVHIMINYDGPMTCYEPVWLGEMWSCARTWRGRATTFEDAPVIIRRFLNKCRPLIVNFRARMFTLVEWQELFLSFCTAVEAAVASWSIPNRIHIGCSHHSIDATCRLHQRNLH